MKFSDVRRDYFLTIDLHNCLDRIVKLELKALYDGKTVVLFIDCYDLIALLFPKGLLADDDHHEWVKAIWDATFESLGRSDNLKVSVSPPAFLELFHFLEKKAHLLWELPSLDPKDFRSFFRGLRPYLRAWSTTSQLVDQAAGRVPQLRRLGDLIREGKVIAASDLFDYSAGRWDDFIGVVGRTFDSEGAARFLRDRRRTKRPRSGQAQEDELSFSVNVDVCNIAQTVYIGEQLKGHKDILFACHGIYVLLACEPRQGFWRDAAQSPPVVNSLLALQLARSLRRFATFELANEFFVGAKSAARALLTEFSDLFTRNESLGSFVKEPQTRSHFADAMVDLPRRLSVAREYLFTHCGLCFPVEQPVERPIYVDATGVRSRDAGNPPVPDEAMELATNESHRRDKAEAVLMAARSSLRDLQLVKTEEVAKLFFPADETAARLLLELQGYTIGEVKR